MARVSGARRQGGGSAAGNQRRSGGRFRGTTALEFPGKSSKKGRLFETEADRFGVDEVEESYRARERRKLGAGGSSAEDFIRLADGADEDDSDDEQERRLMGLEGAEDVLEEEEDDDEEDGEDEDEEVDEDREDDDENGPRTAWGRSAKAFYGDEDEAEESADEEENMRLREEEARQIEEEEEVEGLDEDDFGLAQLAEVARGQRKKGASRAAGGAGGEVSEDVEEASGSDSDLHAILSGLGATSALERDSEKTTVHRLLSSAEFKALSKAERQRILTQEHPELQSLLDQLRTSLKDVRGTLRPLLRKAKARQLMTKEGLSFLDTKNQLLVAYLTYLSYYLLLKTHGISVVDHPVIERLVEVRVLLEKLKPIDERLQFQIERLLQAAQKKSHKNADDDEADDDAEARPRPDLLLGVGEEREDGESTTDDEEEGEKPKKGRKTEDEDDVPQVYKPPKILAMDYHAEDQVNNVKAKAARELRRAAERLKRSELVRAVREEVGDAPEEVGIEQWIQVQQTRLGSAASIAKQRAREAFEEENMVRLSMSKKDRKEQQKAKKLEEHQRRMTVGTTLGELTAFSESTLDALGDDDDPTLGRAGVNKKKQTNALNAYLNAAKQASETARKAEAALQADRAILSRQENQKAHSFNQLISKQKKEKERSMRSSDDAEFDDDVFSSKRKGKRQDYSDGGDVPQYREEDLEAFDELLETQKSRKAAKKKQMEERAKEFIPSIPDEVDGQRATTRQILKNKGLTRKRKKYEGNARVHNRMKFESKMKKLKTIRPPGRAVEGDSYMGEESGIRSNLKKSRNLS